MARVSCPHSCRDRRPFRRVSGPTLHCVSIQKCFTIQFPASRAVPDVQVLWVRQRASFT